MNEHLRPVFEILLPELESAGIRYWVYGGLSIAGLLGRFVRSQPHGDVDVLVCEGDFRRIKSRLGEVCAIRGFGSPTDEPQFWRRKLKVRVGQRELLTIVTVRVDRNAVIHLVGDTDRIYAVNPMNKGTERTVGGFRFVTPNDVCIRQMFVDYTTLRRDAPLEATKKKIAEDAFALLSPEEFRGFQQLSLWTPKGNGVSAADLTIDEPRR